MIKRVASVLAALTFAANGAVVAIADDSNIIDTLEIAEENTNETTEVAESEYSENEANGVEGSNDTDEKHEYTQNENQEEVEVAEEIRIPYNELVEKLYGVKYEISDGLIYTRNILNHKDYGNEREYILEYTPDSETELHFLTNEYLYKTDTIKNMATNSYPEKNFVAGINADFFNMSTGVPESAYINNYELYTTDRDSFCLAQTEDNEYFFDKPQIKLKMLSEDEIEYHIMHLNKEFSEYGLYMYNSRYSDKTHIKNDYTAAVLYPYSECLELDEIQILINDSQFTSKVRKLNRLRNQDSDEAQEVELEVYKLAEELSGYEEIGGKFYKFTDVNPKIGQSENLVVKEVINENTNSLIPENAYLVCADNTTYGYILRQLTPGDTFTFYVDGNEKFYNVKNAIGTGAVILKDSETIDDRTLSHYTSLQPRSAVGIKEDGTLVFYAVDGRRKGHSSGMKLLELAEQMKSLGCTYAANFDGGGSTAVNVSLPGFDDATTVNVPSQTNERKISNAVGFFNNNQKTASPYSAYAYGDYYYTLNDWYVQLGEIILSDENGFSTITETEDEPEDENEIIDENESDIEQDTADSSENQNTDEEQSEQSALEESKNLVPENVNLYIKDGAGFVADGRVYPAGNVGLIDVYATVNGVENENIAATIVSIESPDEINLSTDKKVYAPFDTVNIEFESLFRNLTVGSGFSNFKWSAKPVIEPETTAEETDVAEEKTENIAEETQEEISENEGTPESDVIYGTFEDGVFVPAVRGIKLELIASRGEAIGSVIIDIDDYPFADMQDHWAMKEIYQLAKNGIVKGQYDEDGIAYYLPERNYSRYEFCVMVERITGIGSELEVPEYKSSLDETDETDETEIVSSASQGDEATPEDVEYDEQLSGDKDINEQPDVTQRAKEKEVAYLIDEMLDANSIPEWAYESVYRLYFTGLLDEIVHADENGNKVFNGDKYITRAEVMKVLGKICNNAPDDYTIDDYHDLTEEQKNDIHFKNVINAGLFSGYEDMSLRPDNSLTRAEAAAVFTRLYNLK